MAVNMRMHYTDLVQHIFVASFLAFMCTFHIARLGIIHMYEKFAADVS